MYSTFFLYVLKLGFIDFFPTSFLKRFVKIYNSCSARA